MIMYSPPLDAADTIFLQFSSYIFKMNGLSSQKKQLRTQDIFELPKQSYTMKQNLEKTKFAIKLFYYVLK